MNPQAVWNDVQAIRDRASLVHNITNIVAAALRGGLTAVQLRKKDLSTAEFVRLATGADGVHLGPTDMPYGEVHRWLGPDRIIGLSVETLAQAEDAQRLDPDSLGVIPVHPTPTKVGLRHAFGSPGLRAVRAISRHSLIASGGMNRHTIPDVIRAGADGIAVVSAIGTAADPEQAARERITRIHAVGNENHESRKEGA